MNSEEFAQLEKIVLHAAGLPKDERGAYLDKACTSPEMRQKAEAMLAADPGEIDSLSGEETTVEAFPDTSSSEPEDEEIGLYRLHERIGEGGMGSVYLAEQERPVRRKVALKVIKRGMDTKQVIARFEAERQALALMDHPSIAKVFDAGSTPRGRPYFVMEYVKGVPITEYCDKHRLTTRERLELFMQVCDGVQHAHQKAIIHRDLKPSNLLVTIQDDKPVPKIIDFGVAKATTQKLTEKTVYTALGELIGTPEYMSPEQAEMTGENIDTRTDVYSLGVVLYELLAGALPFEPGELRSAGFRGIVQMIREQDPPKPSTKVSTLGERTTNIAASRRTIPGKLSSQLRGDLDWITMRTLEKDRTRRYGSAAELAADLRRHLQHEPVVAGPPSAAYRTVKFIRRNRIGVSFAGALLVMLAGVAVTMTVERNRANTERDRANIEAERANREAATSERVSEFLVGVFEVSDPGEARGNTVTAREILDNGASRIQRELSDQPLLRATMMSSMGRVYQNLGLYTTAESLLVGALELRRARLGEEHLDSVDALSYLGRLRLRQGRGEDARGILEQTLELRQRLLGDEHVDTAWSLYFLAVTLLGSEARELINRALPIFERELGPNHQAVAWCLNDIGNSFGGDHVSALPYLERSVEIKVKALGPDHWDVGLGRNNLGLRLAALGRLDEARQQLEQACAILEKSLGPDHYQLSTALDSYGGLLNMLGEYEAARVHLERSLRIILASVGEEHWAVPVHLSNLAVAEQGLGQFAKADSLYRRAVPLAEVSTHWLVPRALADFARLNQEIGESATADSLFRRALEESERMSLKYEYWDWGEHARTVESYAALLRDMNRLEEAAAMEERAKKAREKLKE